MSESGSNLPPEQQTHNALYLCCAVKAYPDKFEENGAVALNHMVQERAGLTRAEAFAVVGDAFKAGLLALDKRGGKKRLLVDPATFGPFRDKNINRIGKIESEVVTFNWHLYRPKVTETQDALSKHVEKGRLWDLKKGLPDRLAREVITHFEKTAQGEKQVRPPTDIEKAAFTAVMSAALHRFAKDMPGRDFILVVTRTGDTIRPSLKIIDRESNVEITFD